MCICVCLVHVIVDGTNKEIKLTQTYIILYTSHYYCVVVYLYPAISDDGKCWARQFGCHCYCWCWWWLVESHACILYMLLALWCFEIELPKHMNRAQRTGWQWEKHRLEIFFGGQYGNINRNWRFRFIAHYYWFLLRSLTRPIEITKRSSRSIVCLFLPLSFSVCACAFPFLSCCLFNLFPLEMPTPNTNIQNTFIQKHTIDIFMHLI